jgi:hypothetical protein
VGLVGAARISAAQEWYDEHMRLWALAVTDLKNESQTEARDRYDDKQKGSFLRVFVVNSMN